MSQRLFILVLTIVAFGAGFGAGLWKEQHQPLPPPPGPLGSEFHHHPHSPFGEPPGEHPFNRAELIAQAAALRPQLEAFRAKMDEIESGFNRDLDGILNAEQRARHDENVKHFHDLREHRDGDRTPSSDRMMEQSSRTILFDVVIPLRLDWITREYKLDDAQREKVRALLKDRRNKVLELVDSSPPPSVMLSRLAQRLAPPPPKPAAAP